MFFKKDKSNLELHQDLSLQINKLHSRVNVLETDLEKMKTLYYAMRTRVSRINKEEEKETLEPEQKPKEINTDESFFPYGPIN